MMMIPRSFSHLLLPKTPTNPVQPPAVSAAAAAALSRSLRRARSAMAFNKIQVANPVVEMDGKRGSLSCTVLFPHNRSAALRRLPCAASSPPIAPAVALIS